MALAIDFSKYPPRELAEKIVEDLSEEKLHELVKEIWFKKELEDPKELDIKDDEEPEEPEDKPMFDTTRDDPNRNSPRRYR